MVDADFMIVKGNPCEMDFLIFIFGLVLDVEVFLQYHLKIYMAVA